MYMIGTVKPALGDPPFRLHGNRYIQLVACCWIKVVQNAPKFSVLLLPSVRKAKSISCFILSLNTGLTVKVQNFTLNTSSASMNRVCISFLSHWFQELSLSTSSRLDGTSKSPNIGGRGD